MLLSYKSVATCLFLVHFGQQGRQQAGLASLLGLGEAGPGMTVLLEWNVYLWHSNPHRLFQRLPGPLPALLITKAFLPLLEKRVILSVMTKCLKQTKAVVH